MMKWNMNSRKRTESRANMGLRQPSTRVAVVCSGLAWALTAQATASTTAKVIEIDKSGILDQPGATYVLTKDVTAPRTAFMIKGNGITLDLRGHTITYGTEVGVDYCHGVFLRPGGGEESFKGVPLEGFGGGNDFTLKNGRIVQGKQPVAPEGAITYRSGRMTGEEGDHPRPGRYCHAVYIRGCDGFLVTGVTTEVNSRDSNNIHVLYCKGGEIAGNHCVSTVREISDRHWPGTQVIHVAPVGGPVDIHHNTIDGGGQWGVYVASEGNTGHLIQVHHNVIRHRSYTTNGYALGCHAPNMRVYANVVKSIGRGAHLTANNVDFYNNIIEPRERPNPEYPSTRTHGIKLEHPGHTQVHHNFCRVVAEEGFGDADPLDFDCQRYSCNRIYKNTIEAIARDEAGRFVTSNVTDQEGHAELVLTDYHLIGNRGSDPCLQKGPYELTFFQNEREVRKEKIDPTGRMNIQVTIPEPGRSLYVYAGEDQRLTTGDIVRLQGNVVVEDADHAKPEIAWKVVKGIGGPKAAAPNAVRTDLVFENPTESWLQQAELELSATLGDQTVSDRGIIRQDTNITPKAVITGPKQAVVNTIVQLDASGSTEPRRFPPETINYRWRQTGGPRADLSSPEWINPIFFPEEPGSYTFELTVSSPIATSTATSFTVEVTESGPGSMVSTPRRT
jgi:hypothetical protein